MLALCLDSLDPAFNLALEETLFNSLKPDEPGWFLLWQNGPSIIVGRHQNTVEEVNAELVRTHSLPVVRRMTGGGAVYHDAGNLNFSFLVPNKRVHGANFATFLRPVLEALWELGVEAEMSGRNDIIVAGRKISGSAQARNTRGLLHHGTLIVNLDLDMLGAVLTGAPDKYTSKGIASVRSRVCNLGEILPKDVGMAELKDALVRHCADGEGLLPQEITAAARQLSERKYRQWDWNYGASPAFTEQRRRRFPWGVVECRFNVQRGVVCSCHIYGDFFSQGEIRALEDRLSGIPYRSEDFMGALKDVALEHYFTGCDPVVMYAFLTMQD